MSSFLGLMKKEWILQRNWLLYGLLSIIGVFIASSSIAFFMGNENIAMAPVVIVLSFLIFYSPLFLLISLNMEGKSNLWLHTPQSSFKLLSSKLVTAFYMHIALTLVVGTILFLINNSLQDSVGNVASSNLLLMDIAIFVLVVIFISFYIGLYVVLYWTLNASLKSIKKIQKFRVPLMLVIIIGVNTLLSAFKNVPLYQKIMNFGVIKHTPDGMGNLQFDGGDTQVYLGGDFISLGGIFLILLFITSVLLVSSWLLEKVVEA
ncbi:hypothetical protein [Bacillus alkalisoli]|uniref:hypothetical protein n=1 Tax=Bacillus alkalisoli TaxID=2011008 RepID=UPI000C240EF9|nr:hypothetical protein [Bacillus alkalisoli]